MRRSISWLVMLAGLAAGSRPEEVGRFADPAIGEASGMVRSRKHPGIFWVHNDSGNPAVLFAVRRDGRLVRSYEVAVPNVDWEDIAADDRGHLYLGDIGNNDLRLPLRAVYRLDEPDPSQPAKGPLKPTLVSFYGFEPGHRFDAEGLFVFGDRAMVVSKRLNGKDAEVFAIPLDPPAPILRPAIPARIAKLRDSSEPVTGADLSGDGRRLAVTSNLAARVYLADGLGGWNLLSTVRFEAPDVEAICWDGDDLILASEHREIFRIPEATWKAAARKAR